MLDLLERHYTQSTPFQEKGWKRFLELGVPTKKMETYKYVRLRDFSFEKQETAPPLVQAPEGVIVLPFDQAVKTYGSFLRGRFEALLKEEKDPFAALNAGYFQEGIFIYIPPKLTPHKPIEITVSAEKGALSSPRFHLMVGKDAHVKVKIQSDVEGALNQFFDFALEERASLTLVSQGKNRGWGLTTLRATLKRESCLKTYSFAYSGASREDYHVQLNGENGEVSLNGLWKLDEGSEHHVNVLVEHCEPQCRSKQTFKGVVSGNARSSFEGKIYVHPLAQKTEAYQLNNNLILSKHAAAYSKPNLEIFADDVKASHGATLGQLDPEDLFYLKTRGLSEALAKELLIEGFCQEISSHDDVRHLS